MNRAQVLSSLLAGTARQPIAGVPGANAELNALSLAGQALRFERPPLPLHFAVDQTVADDRTMLPDALRRPLLRLVTGKLATEHAPLALAHTFDRLRLRPHPFDLPRMHNFVRTYAEELGTTTQAWARPQQEGAAEGNAYFDDELLTDETWMHATPARRAAYLEGRRAQDVVAARALLEVAWPQFDADARMRLLQAIEPTLDAADQTFLETLDKDRAPRVRALALRLLSRLGVDVQNPALTELLQRIKRTETGFIRKHAVLTLELAANVKEQAAPMWIREAFGDVSFDELSRALALSEADAIAASVKDSNLLLGLALLATTDRRLDLLQQIVGEHLPNAWELIEQTGLRDLSPMSAGERLRWAAVLVEPYGHKLPTSYLQWSWLHRLLQQPAPVPLLDNALKSEWLDTLNLEVQGAAWMELLAALCPAAQRAALRKRLAGLDSAHTCTALPLLDILDAMENVRPHA